MPKVKGGPRARKRHKKILRLAKGYRGTRSKLFRRAHEAVLRAGEHSFAGRKQRRRDIRRLWITRLTGALSSYDINYSKFMSGLKKADIKINRKMLSQLAIEDPTTFGKIVEKAKTTAEP
jgi:large subunit ribosomal protein L20